jgi:hypothetical protein
MVIIHIINCHSPFFSAEPIHRESIMEQRNLGFPDGEREING